MVPQAAIPVNSTFVPVPTVDALEAQPLGNPAEESSLTTIAVGTPGVRVLLIKSLRAEREAKPFGVTRHEQQEINCSSGENTYAFTHMLPFCTGNAVVELAPVLVTFTTESPMLRLDA